MCKQCGFSLRPSHLAHTFALSKVMCMSKFCASTIVQVPKFIFKTSLLEANFDCGCINDPGLMALMQLAHVSCIAHNNRCVLQLHTLRCDCKHLLSCSEPSGQQNLMKKLTFLNIVSTLVLRT